LAAFILMRESREHKNQEKSDQVEPMETRMKVKHAEWERVATSYRLPLGAFE